MTDVTFFTSHFLFIRRTYIIFAVFNACFIPVMYFFYVETKGKSLEEIDLLFSKHSSATTIGEAKREKVAHNEYAESDHAKGDMA